MEEDPVDIVARGMWSDDAWMEDHEEVRHGLTALVEGTRWKIVQLEQATEVTEADVYVIREEWKP